MHLAILKNSDITRISKFGEVISFWEHFCAFGYLEKLLHDSNVKKASHFLKDPETSRRAGPSLAWLDVSGTLENQNCLYCPNYQ